MIKWRDIKDELPEKNKDCLVKSEYEEYFVAWRNDDSDEFKYSHCCGCVCTITHWIYLQNLLDYVVLNNLDKNND